METFKVKVNPDGSATFSQDLLRRLDFQMGGELDFSFEGGKAVSVDIRKSRPSDLFPETIQQLIIKRVQEMDEDHQYVDGWEDWRPKATTA